ncbi:MAG: YggS family pyridoxal phosphate-dependent enzyme, partial [Phycisphaerae bacterium]
LQRNKVKQALPWVEMVHSLDSLRLAEEISLQAQKIGKTVEVLLQVNAAEETQKSGVAVGAVPHLAEQVVSLPGIRLCGLMAMAPLTSDAGRVAWTFERTREIFDDMAKERFLGSEFCHLSMGMSGDFEVAIEQGATLVRIGSAVFD